MREVRIDPGLWRRPDMLAALGCRDITVVYRMLQRHGLSQRQIAAMTGQSQSEISEILSGRRVVAYDVLTRIADGLKIPRGLLGLAHEQPAPPAALENAGGPVWDAVSGRWMVRVPVYVDSHQAAMGLHESTRPAPTRAAADELAEAAAPHGGGAPVPAGWRLSARAVLRERWARLRPAVQASTGTLASA